MTEEEKIKQTIEIYKDYFNNSKADVFHSEKGVWAFWEYDEEYDYCNSFIFFETAEELEGIIAGLIASDTNLLIEVTAEGIQHSLHELDINEALQSSYETSIPRLLENIEILNSEFQRWGKELDVLFQSLSGILDRLKN